MSSHERYPAERLAAHDPAWSGRYEEISADLARALGPGWRYEHVGSTSVPGLAAKPVIDLALAAPAERSVAEALGALDGTPWTSPVVVGDHWATFLLAGGVRTAIGHVFTACQWPQAHVRLFSAWLRDHPADRDRYGRLKAGLVHQGVWGREYTEAKTSFVREIVDRAREARGLPELSSAI